MKYVLSIISILLALASCGCSDSTSKQGKARETRYLYRVVDGKNYVGGFHEDRECSTLKAALRKWPALSVERFQKAEIAADLNFCSCISDKTYDEIMKNPKLKEINDSRKRLYEILSADYNMGTFEQFCADLKDATKRRKLYDAISSDYSDVGSFDEFESKLGYGDGN